ncbi:MAG: class I SAM-dependent rRNA methyltransferase [Bacteroidota bacterium]|nr:class I SAM-dependent rRNA methyltransferase [Bacteroidota bacterium]
MAEYPKILLKAGRERSLYNRHPWVFSGALQAMPTDVAEGEVVAVCDSKGELLGQAFFSSRSTISLRMLTFAQELEDIDTVAWWQNRFTEAVTLRRELFDVNQTNAYRLIHAEGDQLPGLIIDVYNTVVVLQILIVGIERKLDLITQGLHNIGYTNQFIKAKTSAHVLEDTRPESANLSGNTDEDTVQIIENGLKFNINYKSGQKTGFFIDQRDNRALLEQYSKGKTVLNTFSYSGGFSLYALRGGATRVVSVDIMADAIRQCNENVTINYPDIGNHTSVTADCFEYLKEMPDNEFDIIVLDPPAFAKSQKAVKNATRGYKQINLQAFRKIATNGIIFTYSCSQNISTELFRKIVFGAAADARRHVRIIHQLHQPPDHPISIYHPEGEYLKGLVLQIL